MNKVLITGASGFLGRAVVTEFLKMEFEVHLLDREIVEVSGAHVHSVDLLDLSSLTQVFKSRFDFIYHLGAIAGISDSRDMPLETIQTNVLGTANLLELTRKQNHGRFVFASSVYVHSKQGSIYAATKRCSELLIEKYSQEYGVEYTILRFGSIYGPGANNFNFISNTILKGINDLEIIYQGSGNEKREYVHVSDAAKLAFEVTENQYKNEILKITGSQRISIRELFEIISESLGKKIEVRFVQEDNNGHYSQTPYNYLPAVSRRIVPKTEVDLPGGVYDVIMSML